ncbi:MAG: hypothetical protein U5J95_08750 [Balneolaceae bacterium]|nr:hypothetical protein [Balneolaceae bacterium]
MKLNYIIILFLLLAFTACKVQTDNQNGLELPDVNVQTDSFKDYWYSGKAELAHYDLQQIRYGEIRDGDATLIFVTEDFLLDKQVKLESPADGRDAPTVLKLNFMKEFVTGIYKYNVMTSTFTPIDLYNHPNTLKVASSSQEWCGTTYSQLNFRDGQYEVTGHSYFEKEADYSATLENTWLEDELWTKLRLSPELLPEGEIDIIPGSFEVRTSHDGWSVRQATATKSKWNGEGDFPGENLMAYKLDYQEADRTLTIIYEPISPYRIAGWIETQQARNGETLTARSVRTDVIQEPYWQQNANADEDLRKKLGLEN